MERTRKEFFSGALRNAKLLPVVLLFATPLVAQRPQSDTVGSSDPAARARTEHQVTMDIQRESLLKGTPANNSDNQKQLQAVTAQLKQDFERLWSISQELIAATSTRTGPSYKYVLDETAEVRSRAGRLQNMLSLPRPEGKPKITKSKDPQNRQELHAAILQLSNVIVNFVTNPYFRKPKVFDAELVSKAGNDLEAIIELSRSLRNSSERLNKLSEIIP
jgi:hypothetical protein